MAATLFSEISGALLVLSALLESWRLRNSGTKLILKHFHSGDDTGNGQLLKVLGRSSGIVSFVLGLFGLEPKTSFSITNTEVIRETVGLSGLESKFASFQDVTVSTCAYYRAVSFLFLSFSFYLFGLFRLAVAMSIEGDFQRQSAVADASYILWLCAGFGTGCYLWYSRSKRILLSVKIRGAEALGISFGENLIENKRVNLQAALAAMDRVNTAMLRQERR